MVFKKKKKQQQQQQPLQSTSQNDVICTNKIIIVKFYKCPEHMLDYPHFFFTDKSCH